MLIGLNSQRLLIDSPAGPEKYTYHIYNGLAKLDFNNQYTLYFSEKPTEDFFIKLTNGNKNFSYKVIKSNISWTQHGLSTQLFKDTPDIFFTPIHTLPIIRPTKTKYIAMIHGLEFKHVTSKNPIKKFLLGKPERYTCKNADFLIVPSDGTRDEILKKNCANKSQIEVIHEGVDENFYKRSGEEIINVRTKYKLGDNKYFLFVGTVQPRKNLSKTIEALSKARKELSDNSISLVIVGKLGWNYEESMGASKKFDVENSIFYLGRVPDEDLPTLISGASALVNFSLEEGFGLPLLEAMACETKCLVSDIPPFKEICGGFATYINPNDIEDMKMGFINTLNSSDKDLISKAKERALGFSWDKSAKETLLTFERIFKNL
jgi:glycosyltransferase involved in cell wall biosynthesis